MKAVIAALLLVATAASANAGDNYIDGLVACRRAIENSAKYDLRWTDSIWGRPKFNSITTTPVQIIFLGDEAEAQNGFGNWVRVRYSCSYDLNTKTVRGASLIQGRLPH